MREFRIIIALLVVMLLVAGCASQDSYMPSSGEDATRHSDYDYSDGNYEADEIVRQKIYEGYMSLEVENLKDALKDINNEAERLGGFVEYSRQWDSSPPTGRAIFRVPQEKFFAFIDFLETLGNARDQYVTITDVTEEYIDLQARLSARIVHEQRLLDLLEAAETIDDLLRIESELARVRSEIETLEGRIRYLDSQVAMSRVEIDLRQEKEETEIPPLSPMGIMETLRRAGRSLSHSFTMFLNSISYLVIGFAASLPFVIPAGVVIWFWRKKRRQRKERQQQLQK